MCLPKPEIPVAQLPPPPIRASEEIAGATNDAMQRARKRPGSASTQLTGGMGDSGYGNSVTRTTLGGM